MKLEDLKDDAERINYLLFSLHYLTACELCLNSYVNGGPCAGRPGLMSGSGNLCPNVDFNDVRPVLHD